MSRYILVISIAVGMMFASSCNTSPEKATSSSTPAATSAPTSTENVEQAIRQLVNERDQAVQRGDTAAIDRIYADDYISTNIYGVVRTKSQVIEDFKSGALKIESVTSDEVNVRAHGDTAIVTGRTTMKVQDRGRDTSGQSRFTQVYMKRNGRWQIVAFQLTRIAQ